jgi:tyrosine-protein kinase Etk/Wzc
MVVEKKVSFLDLVEILLEKKWLLAAITILFTIAGFAISSIMTKYYTATATVLQPKQKIAGGLNSLLSELPMSGMMKGMNFLGQSDEEQFLNILQSRRLADKAIEKFNLIHRYSFDKQKKYYYETVIKTFHKNMAVVENKYDNIEVSFTDSNPEFAAQMTNFIILQLDTINFTISKESARNSRQFFEERLDLIKTDLDSASQRLARYQVANNYIDLEQQVKSSIEALSQIEAQKMGIDLEIEQTANQFGSNSQRMLELLKNRKVLEDHLSRVLKDGDKGLFVPLKKAPEAAITYGYLYRDVKTQAALYQFVVQLFEQAKFSEANTVPTVQVLEWAQTPQMKTRPKRMIFMILFFFIGFSGGCIGILLRRWYKDQQSYNSEAYQRIRRILFLLFSLRPLMRKS